MSVLGGINEVCLCCEMQMVAWLESAKQQNCFYWKENISKLPQRKQEENSPPAGFYHLVMVIFFRHHEEQGVVSLAEQRYGNEPKMSSARSPTEMTCSAWGQSCAPLPLWTPLLAVLSASKMLIFLASAFVFAEHHQESDRTKICVQVCLLSWDFKNGSTCCGNQQREPFAAGQRL